MSLTFNISSVTYQIQSVEETTPQLYDLEFQIPDSVIPADAQIRYSKVGDTALDSGFHFPSENEYEYTFDSLSELQIEGQWQVQWSNIAIGQVITEVLTIPQGAITSTPPNEGLDALDSEIEVSLNDDDSPYLAKQVHVSNLAISLESFSTGAEYLPIKTYTIPNGVRLLSLEVNDYIPASYLGPRSTWIQYAIVIDEEEYPITPQNRPGNNPMIYHIDSPLLGPARTARQANNEGFIDTEGGKVTEVALNIRLGRPDGQPATTPIVFGYKLKYIDYETA